MEELNSTYEIYYDETADFLEVFIGAPSKCYAEELEKGIFIRKDEETDEIKSIGIFSFKKRGTELLKEVLKKVNVSLPLEVV